MRNQKVLLKEYETCQQDINTTVSRYWITVGIFIGVNTALWAAIVYKTASTSLANNINWEWIVTPILVTIFGLAMIIILHSLGKWLDRVNWLLHVKYFRMRQIENRLGMMANIYIDALDNWNQLSKEQRTRNSLDELHTRYPAVSREGLNLHFIYNLLTIIWILLILVAWLFPILI